jgi:AAA15 family ATPase/GTPase
MILEFKVENFRSIKEEQVFSFVAETTKSKADNVFKVNLPKNSSVRLLKSAVIYGANASGKSNFLKAIATLKKLVTDSSNFKLDTAIREYEPFLLDTKSRDAPTKFELVFIPRGKKNVKYHYSIAYNKNEITAENLDFYEKGQVANLFKRICNKNDFHEIKTTEKIGKKGIPTQYLKNQLILSKFGSEPQIILNNVYRYFDDLDTGNTLDGVEISDLTEELGKKLVNPENKELSRKLSLLIRAADTQIENVAVSRPLQRIKLPLAATGFMFKENPPVIKGKHNIYEDGKVVGSEHFDFAENISLGTSAMFAIGGIILQKFEEGGVLLFDELDNSLHPKVTRFLIGLFHNPEINKANAQIIFSTHEPLLMDKDMFRSDQIWFTKKNKFGATEMYSAQDFEGIREDIPFNKWYMAGKFGALPNIEQSLLSL